MESPQKQGSQVPPNQKMQSISETEKRWKEFASRQLTNAGYLMNSGAVFVNDPYLLNQRIKQLKTQPVFMDREKIEDALMKPETHELALRTATHSMLYMTYPLYRLQYLYEGILKYRSYIQPLYVDKETMNTRRFKSDWKFVDMWHKKLCPQKQFRRIVAEVLAEGKRAYYLRQSYCTTTEKEAVNYVFFEDLPSDWYKIIKHSTDSYEVVAFNFAYFWQAGTSLGQFPPIFAKYYEEMMACTEVNDRGLHTINPDLAPEDVVVEYNRETLRWFYWRELPVNECFVFSFTEADDLQCSPFSALLLQAQDLGSYSLLQQQLLSVPLYSILLGEIPMNENNRSGSHLDDFVIAPETMVNFEGRVNSQMPPGTSYSMVPSKNNELYHFQEVPNANSIYTSGLQQLLSTAGVSTLLTTTEKPSVAQVNAGKVVETRFIDRMYDQFAWACNVILRDMYDRKDLVFQWHFRIFGDAFSEKDTIAALEKALSFGQTQFLPEYLAYHDQSLLDAITTSDWVEASGIYERFRPIVNSYAQKSGGTSSVSSDGEEKKPGRPQADENNIDNDDTANSIDGGMNTGENR